MIRYRGLKNKSLLLLHATINVQVFLQILQLIFFLPSFQLFQLLLNECKKNDENVEMILITLLIANALSKKDQEVSG